MRLSFFNRPEQFTKMQPKTPAEEGEHTWDKREGQIVVQNYNLRKMLIGVIILAIVLAVGLVIQSLKSTVEPYIVRVDTTTGRFENVGLLKEVAYTPQEAEIKYFLSQFVINTRKMPLDPVVHNEQLNSAVAFLTKSAAAKLNAEFKNEKILEQFGKKTVQVNITSVLPMEQGSNSYQIRWNEEEFFIGSGEKIVTPMTSIFTITNIPAKDEATLKVNPLGLYITDFNWSKDATASNATTKTNVNRK